MASVQVPSDGVFRIARGPEPFALPDWDRAGDDGTFGNRFDDPGALLNIPLEKRYRVLYCATQRQAAFGEVTARFRPASGLFSRLGRIEDDEETIAEALSGAVDPRFPEHGLLEHDWMQHRRIGHSRIVTDSAIADVSHADSLAHLSEVLARIPGVREVQPTTGLDLSSITSQDRRLTQFASAYIYSLDFAGIRYTSRLGDNWECWALFEGRFHHQMGSPELARNLSPDDEDLLAVARMFGLTIEVVRGMGHFLRPWQEQL